ncbi:MAG: protein kinase [Myxococcales bacterium]|nr:protein kinase [Myxococcales bacterium]
MAAPNLHKFNWLQEEQGVDGEVFGPYVVTRHLGSGGTSTVDEAVRQGAYGFVQRIALKRVLQNLAAHPDFTAALIREGKLASHLNHPGIAKTFDLGCVAGTYYIAMELVTGIDLRRILVRLAERRQTMPPAIALHLLSQIVDALDYAHTITDSAGTPLGITHRDVSPANVLVGFDGMAKLIDFGVAKATASMFMTTSGKIKGKFAYMAPEAMAGRVDHRVDLFGAGIMAYEMLTARPLFAAASDVETIQRIKKWNPPSLVNQGISPEFDAIIAKALAKNPDERWATAAAMSAAIEHLRRQRDMATSQAQVATWLASLDDVSPPRKITTAITMLAKTPPANESACATVRMDIASIMSAAGASLATPAVTVAMVVPTPVALAAAPRSLAPPVIPPSPARKAAAPRPLPANVPGATIIARHKPPGAMARLCWRGLAICGGIFTGFAIAYTLLN